MITYFYTREIVNDHWNINNPERVDIDGNQIYLSKEVETALPEATFRMYCNGSEVCFLFDSELSVSDKETLDTCVSNHKNNL